MKSVTENSFSVTLLCFMLCRFDGLSDQMVTVTEPVKASKRHCPKFTFPEADGHPD